MTQRACFLPLGVVVLFLGSALRPVAAYVDRGEWVSVSVEPLTPGEYTVRYRAVFSDTHLVSGAWVFEVRHQ